MKKKLDELTKCKLIYSGELLFFALLMLVLGLLFGFKVIVVQDWKKWAFTIITLVGGFWAVTDFIWTLRSPKRRQKSALIDKILLLPNGLALIGLDFYALINLARNPEWGMFGEHNFFQIEIGVAIIYVGIVFLFESIYHWFHIHPMVYEMIEEDKQKEQEENKNLENNDNNNEEHKDEN